MDATYNGFYITDSVGNNRLNYDKRVYPRIYVPALIEGYIEDVQTADTIAIECDVDGGIVAGAGLKNSIFLRGARVPTWIFDNHNHAYYFWHFARYSQMIGASTPLIHIDQHTDLEKPVRFRETDENIFSYTHQVLTIADFIIPALQEGLVTEAHIITDETIDSARCFAYEGGALLRRNTMIPKAGYILDIDLDYFSQGFDYEKTLHLVRSFLPGASLVTIATSPLFIEQKEALRILGIIGQYL